MYGDRKFKMRKDEHVYFNRMKDFRIKTTHTYDINIGNTLHNEHFHGNGTLLSKHTFPHCIQTVYCVILIKCNCHPEAIARNPHATFHEDTSYIC